MAETLETRIKQEYTQALKARDTATVSTLRLLLTSLKNEQIAKRRALTEDEEVQVLQREAKRRREAITVYQQGGSADRAAVEQTELEVITRYLPEQMDAGAIAATVAQIVGKTGATGPADFGRVMGLAMQELKGKADGAAVRTCVKTALEQLVA